MKYEVGENNDTTVRLDEILIKNEVTDRQSSSTLPQQ